MSPSVTVNLSVNLPSRFIAGFRVVIKYISRTAALLGEQTMYRRTVIASESLTEGLHYPGANPTHTSTHIETLVLAVPEAVDPGPLAHLFTHFYKFRCMLVREL